MCSLEVVGALLDDGLEAADSHLVEMPLPFYLLINYYLLSLSTVDLAGAQRGAAAAAARTRRRAAPTHRAAAGRAVRESTNSKGIRRWEVLTKGVSKGTSE